MFYYNQSLYIVLLQSVNVYCFITISHCILFYYNQSLYNVLLQSVTVYCFITISHCILFYYNQSLYIVLLQSVIYRSAHYTQLFMVHVLVMTLSVRRKTMVHYFTIYSFCSVLCSTCYLPHYLSFLCPRNKESGGGILIYPCPSVRPSIRI